MTSRSLQRQSCTHHTWGNTARHNTVRISYLKSVPKALSVPNPCEDPNPATTPWNFNTSRPQLYTQALTPAPRYPGPKSQNPWSHPCTRGPKSRNKNHTLQNPVNTTKKVLRTWTNESYNKTLQQSSACRNKAKSRGLGSRSLWVIPHTTVTLLRSAAPQKRKNGPRYCSGCMCVYRPCMCVCIYIYTHYYKLLNCIHTYIHAHIHTYVRQVFAFGCSFSYFCSCAYLCNYEYTLVIAFCTCGYIRFAVMYVCMYVYTYTYICMCVHIYIYVYIHIKGLSWGSGYAKTPKSSLNRAPVIFNGAFWN